MSRVLVIPDLGKFEVSQYRLAEFFGVKQPTISKIIGGISWQES